MGYMCWLRCSCRVPRVQWQAGYKLELAGHPIGGRGQLTDVIVPVQGHEHAVTTGEVRLPWRTMALVSTSELPVVSTRGEAGR